MEFRNILKLIFLMFIIVFITACSVNTENENTTYNSIEEIDKDEKTVEYKREEISEKLLHRVGQIVQAIYNNNLILINEKFINPKFGFYNLYKVDGIKTFTYQKFIYNIQDSQSEEISDLISEIEELDEPFDIKLEEVSFDCSPNNDEFYGWNKDGIFLNSNTNKYLTNIMFESNKYEKNRYKKADFREAKFIEKTSYKVIVTPDIVFYVSKIDEEWYISLFDRITSDCSTS